MATLTITLNLPGSDVDDTDDLLDACRDLLANHYACSPNARLVVNENGMIVDPDAPPMTVVLGTWKWSS